MSSIATNVESTAVVEQENSENKQNLRNYSVFSLCDTDEMTKMLTGLSLADFTSSFEQELYSTKKEISNENSGDQSSLTISCTMTCSVCSTTFADRNEQISHYKLDWHRYNLKLKLQGERPISESKFDDVSGAISSLSGSESSSDNEKSDGDTSSSDIYSSPRRQRPSALPFRVKPITPRERSSSVSSVDTEPEDSECTEKNRSWQSRLQPKLYFKNQFDKVIALYRCVVHGKQNVPQSQHDLLSMVTSIPNQICWAVVLVGGGHFAAAIYNQSEVVLHKTFHRYTVRAKQGTSQNTRDSKHSGSQPKSAGANLRRQCEASLITDIQDLLNGWNAELQKCSHIFYRAPSFNRIALFSGKNPPFKKDDVRLRNIPFPTRRATFHETQRIFKVLSTLECFGERTEKDKTIPQSPKLHLGSKPAKKMSNSPTHKQSNDALQEDTSNVPVVKQKSKRWTKSSRQEHPSNSRQTNGAEGKDLSGTYTSDSEDCIEFQHVNETVLTSDLKEFACYRHKRRRHKTKPRSESLTKRQEDPAVGILCEEKYHMKNALYTACQTGDVSALEKLLNILKNASHPETNSIAQITQEENVQLVEESVVLDESRNETVLSAENVYARVSNKENDTICTGLKEDNTDMKKQYLRSHENDDMGSEEIISDCKLIFQENTILTKESDNPNSSTDYLGSKVKRKRNKIATKAEQDFQLSNLTLGILNDAINDIGATLLHVATKEGHRVVVRMLMEYGANPVVRDKRGITPYMTSNDREMRNEYRLFMAANPDKFDYKEAQIPSPLTEEMIAERTEKRKEKKKLQKERNKEKKEIEMKNKLEDEEKRRFLSLSDREKRAFAAERRYTKQLQENGQICVLSRCFQCGKDITGKVPFEYNENRFCSTSCVKEHRKLKTC